MAKEKKEKKSKEDKKKEKEEKKKEKEEKKGKGKKEKKEKEEKPKKEKKDKKEKKEKSKEKPKKEKKKKRKKGEPEEPETQEALEAPEEEEEGKKGKKGKKKKADKKSSKKKSKGSKGSKKEPKKSPSAEEGEQGTEGAELPEGAEGAEGAEGEQKAEEQRLPWFNLSWAFLHLLGMGFMLCDNLWITIFPADDWLTCLGRLTFPIFAFLLVEGFFHTENLWRYLLRLLALAALSEIPFNLFYGGSIIYPLHQNVIWTYVIALIFMILLEEFKDRFGFFPMLLFMPIPAFLGYFLGQVLLTDYYGAGVLIILMFYLFHGRHWVCLLGQLVCLWFINLKLLGGYYYVLPFLGYNFEFIQQAFAVLSLLIIWLYYGRQGLHGRVFRWFCYLFYPIHMLVLCIIRFKLLY